MRTKIEFSNVYSKHKQIHIKTKTTTEKAHHTGALGGKIAVATDINPFSTRVKYSFSLSVGLPMCMVRVTIVAPSKRYNVQY